jgi:hypothetical protein
MTLKMALQWLKATVRESEKLHKKQLFYIFTQAYLTALGSNNPSKFPKSVSEAFPETFKKEMAGEYMCKLKGAVEKHYDDYKNRA